jgi:hypothetical protein
MEQLNFPTCFSASCHSVDYKFAKLNTCGGGQAQSHISAPITKVLRESAQE